MDVWDMPENVWEDTSETDSNEVLWTLAEEMWADIPYKKRVPNELAPIMLERVIAMASNPGQIVVDPFGGSGTTFYAAEKLHRYWIGSEIVNTEPAIERLTDLANGIIEQWESARGNKKLKQRKTTAPQLSIPYST